MTCKGAAGDRIPWMLPRRLGAGLFRPSTVGPQPENPFPRGHKSRRGEYGGDIKGTHRWGRRGGENHPHATRKKKKKTRVRFQAPEQVQQKASFWLPRCAQESGHYKPPQGLGGAWSGPAASAPATTHATGKQTPPPL